MTAPLQSPFDEASPHPLAKAAADELAAELPPCHEPDGGKMYGVLVARDASGAQVVLRAFSGMLDGRWDVDGFSPPIFDRAARARVEPDGEACVKALSARVEAARRDARLEELEQALDDLARRHGAALHELTTRHAARRARRHELRSASDCATGTLHALDQESRADKAERRRMEAAFAAERVTLEAERCRLVRRLRALERLRGMVSRRLMQRLHDCYVVTNARGERRPLRSLYPNGEPPSGAGDCAAPKLLAAAYRRALTPVALAEFWWGPPPRTGGRVHRSFYPSCRLKCGPLLPFMLEGLEVAPARKFAVAPSHAPLEIVFESEGFVVVDKPPGLLSVPGKGEAAMDSVLARIRRQIPRAEGPMIVHRLDLDTSGLLVVALTAQAYASLQRQFAARSVEKRYVAILDGRVEGEAGAIDLPIRVDLDDRPRQIHDPVHGKRAVTEWRVLDRSGDTTRVALWPITGRTHQLRVHAAHPSGLGAPIVGDRLYGRPAERLLLHAEALSFDHPLSGVRLHFERRAAF